MELALVPKYALGNKVEIRRSLYDSENEDWLRAILIPSQEPLLGKESPSGRVHVERNAQFRDMKGHGSWNA